MNLYGEEDAFELAVYCRRKGLRELGLPRAYTSAFQITNAVTVMRDGWRWIVDAHKDDGKRYIVESDELLSASCIGSDAL